MKPLLSLHCVILFLFSAGCASLHVDIDALDTDYVENAKQIREARQEARHLLAEYGGPVWQNFASSLELLQRNIDAIRTLVQRWVRDEELDQGDVADFNESLVGRFGEKRAAIISARSDVIRWAGELLATRPVADSLVAAAQMRKARTLLEASIASMRTFLENDLEGELRNVVPEFPTTIEAFSPRARELTTVEAVRSAARSASADAKVVQDKAQQAPTPAVDLASDENVALIVGAPKEVWRNEFSYAHGDGQLGNVDIAINFELTHRPTIKGVRVDAAKLTRAAFDAMYFAVRAAAAMYGIPISTPDTSSKPDETPKTVTSGSDKLLERIRTADSGVQINQQKIALARAARVDLLDAILTQRQALEGDQAARAAAITRIKSVLDALKSRLSPEATPAAAQK